MNKLKSNELDKYLEVTLNERELRLLSAHTPKQKEVYLMKKFINKYKFYSACNYGVGSKADCFRKMNEYLVKHKDYTPKKNVTTVTKLWDAPFYSYE
ncbi:hypothetical protein ABE55_27295 [Bacillus thuringiensis]|uniref:hypothetical protein n=1 Tax=Bacillus cereus group TaxID=86661 RepID=UPI001374CAA6|nr:MULTISPECIES: hypothetical protein [Bacillus cereus group]MBG9470152.1 hypothetical protein [Bacillus thuringiensis]